MVYEENVTRHTDRPLFWKTPSTKTTRYAMSKVVFGQPILSPRPLLYLILPPSVVGNVPYNMGEARSHYQSFPRPPRSPHLAQDQLIDVFKSVGQVVGFRCVSDQSHAHSQPRSQLTVSCLTVKPVNQRAMGFASLRVHFMFLFHHANRFFHYLTHIRLINRLLKTMTLQCLLFATSTELTSGDVLCE